MTWRIVAFWRWPAAIVFLIVLSSTKWSSRTSGITRAAISLNTGASIGELWMSPSVATGSSSQGLCREIVASGADLEADRFAVIGERADRGVRVEGLAG